MARRKRDSRTQTEDELSARILELTAWARNNSTVLVIFGVILVLLVGGTLYYVNFQERVEQEAISELERIQNTVAAGNAEAARAELQQFIERYGGTEVAPEARLTLARLQLEGGQPQRALEVLEGSDRSIRDPLGTQIHLLMAKSYEAAGRLDQAVETFLDVADDAELDFQRREALADAARVRSLQGRPGDAADLYARIVEQLEEGAPERGYWQMREAEARAEARS